MHGNRMNIYASCRVNAGLSQEAAAELLECSVRSVASWEAGERRPPDDKALAMSRAYHSPLLAMEHLRESSELAQSIVPAIEDKPLAQAVLAVLSEIRAFTAAELDWGLMEIAADGTVSPDERRGFEFLMFRLERVVQAAYELRLCREAIKKPADTEAPTGHIKMM